MRQPLCFVLMPYHTKRDDAGRLIDFDLLYAELIKPAIEVAELKPIRQDEEIQGGVFHKRIFERLVLCEYAVADLTTANPNVFYELGIRHATRPWSTVLIYREGRPLPLDVALATALPYRLDKNGAPERLEATRDALAGRLVAARGGSVDSPIFQLLVDFPPPKLDHARVDTLREQLRASSAEQERIEEARWDGPEALRRIEVQLGAIADTDADIVLSLFLAYRAVGAWTMMIELVETMAAPLRETRVVREQLAFALNRAKNWRRAEAILRSLLDDRQSSETYGLLGRIYKDRWDELRTSEPVRARGFLEKAIDAYLGGFRADWRDPYPGINAVTLMELRDPPDERLADLLPVVRWSAARGLESDDADYWTYATQLELAVLAEDRAATERALGRALAAVRERFEPETTARNLRLIREKRAERGTLPPAWILDVEEALRGVME